MKTDKIKLLALDLDGTTLSDGNFLASDVKAAIEKAVSYGIEIIAASGRPFGTMPDEVLGIDGVNYAVTSNGANIYHKGKCIRRLTLNPDDVLTLLKITEPYDLIFEAFIDGLTYTDLRYVQNPGAYGCSEAYFDYVRSAHGHISDMRKFIFEHRNMLESVEFIETNSELSKNLWNKIERAAPNMYITSSTGSFVEFMNINATKAKAVAWICNQLKIDRKNTAACGNADNDADMVKWAGLGAAVANATPLCKAAANISVVSNNSGGVAELINIICGE